MPDYSREESVGLGNQRLIRGLGSILTVGTFYYWILLFSCSKASDADIGIIANFVLFVKTPKTNFRVIHTFRLLSKFSA